MIAGGIGGSVVQIGQICRKDGPEDGSETPSGENSGGDTGLIQADVIMLKIELRSVLVVRLDLPIFLFPMAIAGEPLGTTDPDDQATGASVASIKLSETQKDQLLFRD